MKKFILGLILGISLLFVVGCDTGYNSISYQELLTSLENKESFVLVVGQSTCAGCQSYKPELDVAGKETGVSIKYIESDKLPEADGNALYNKYVVNVTPTTIFIIDGEETSTYDRLVGTQSSDNLIEAIKAHGYVE